MIKMSELDYIKELSPEEVQRLDSRAEIPCPKCLGVMSVGEAEAGGVCCACYCSADEIEDPNSKILDGYRNQLKVGQKLEHWKGGKYKILALAIDENSMAAMCVYQSESGMIWTRSCYDMLYIVKWNDGVYRPRFRNL